jgi:hypothetical protein
MRLSCERKVTHRESAQRDRLRTGLIPPGTGTRWVREREAGTGVHVKQFGGRQPRVRTRSAWPDIVPAGIELALAFHVKRGGPNRVQSVRRQCAICPVGVVQGRSAREMGDDGCAGGGFSAALAGRRSPPRRSAIEDSPSCAARAILCFPASADGSKWRASAMVCRTLLVRAPTVRCSRWNAPSAERRAPVLGNERRTRRASTLNLGSGPRPQTPSNARSA